MADYRDYIGIDATYYLEHYGVGHLNGGNSGRYPWGSGEKGKRRAAKERQKARESLRKGPITAGKVVKSIPKYAVKAYKAGRKFAVRRFINRSSPQRIYKYRNHLTNEELKEAIERIDMQRQISEVNRLEREKAMKKFEVFFTGLSTAAKYIDTASTLRKSIRNFRGIGETPKDATPYTTQQAKDIMKYIETTPGVTQDEFSEFLKMLNSVSSIEKYSNGAFNNNGGGGGKKNKK